MLRGEFAQRGGAPGRLPAQVPHGGAGQEGIQRGAEIGIAATLAGHGNARLAGQQRRQPRPRQRVIGNYQDIDLAHRPSLVLISQ